ncbi:BrnT family toxin [Alkalilacustris brevis]|uniref:BrnT family toxin n=1 Tax=Alkalilacustris brevis TaxID=2026338 RepID=UPI000E0DD98A
MEYFSWDETKRLRAIEKHKIDFADAATIFLGFHLVLPARSDIEQRQIAVGKLNGIVISVVYTVRGETCRIITARRARRDEREHYEALLSGRDSPDEGRN